MSVERIATAAVSLSTVTAPVLKLCPVKDEVDHGTVTISYDHDGEAFELHSLAAYLATFKARRISHEDFTAEVAAELKASVSSRWHTAGMTIQVYS